MLTEKELNKFANKFKKEFGEQTTAYYMSFSHVYLTNGFQISKELFDDGQEDYKPARTHACLRFGYWCWPNLLEHPSDVINFVIVTIKHYVKAITTQTSKS